MSLFAYFDDKLLIYMMTLTNIYFLHLLLYFQIPYLTWSASLLSK